MGGLDDDPHALQARTTPAPPRAAPARAGAVSSTMKTLDFGLLLGVGCTSVPGAFGAVQKNLPHLLWSRHHQIASALCSG